MAVTGWRSWSASGKACSLKGLWPDQGAHVWLFEVGWMGSVGGAGRNAHPKVGSLFHCSPNPDWRSPYPGQSEPSPGLFRGSENRDARSKRALSRLVLTRAQDCRQAGTLQATLAEGYPDLRFACRKNEKASSVVWCVGADRKMSHL